MMNKSLPFLRLPFFIIILLSASFLPGCMCERGGDRDDRLSEWYEYKNAKTIEDAKKMGLQYFQDLPDGRKYNGPEHQILHDDKGATIPGLQYNHLHFDKNGKRYLD